MWVHPVDKVEFCSAKELGIRAERHKKEENEHELKAGCKDRSKENGHGANPLLKGQSLKGLSFLRFQGKCKIDF